MERKAGEIVAIKVIDLAGVEPQDYEVIGQEIQMLKETKYVLLYYDIIYLLSTRALLKLFILLASNNYFNLDRRERHVLKFYGAYINKKDTKLWLVTEFINGGNAKELVHFPNV